MPTLKSPAPSSPSKTFTFTLEEIMDGPRPGRFEPARDAAWLALHREALAAAHEADFDARSVLGLPSADVRLWQDRRLAHLARHFAADRRVVSARVGR